MCNSFIRNVPFYACCFYPCAYIYELAIVVSMGSLLSFPKSFLRISLSQLYLLYERSSVLSMCGHIFHEIWRCMMCLCAIVFFYVCPICVCIYELASLRL